MAFLVQTEIAEDGPTLFVLKIGRRGVTWTPDRTKARRFRTRPAAEAARGAARRVTRNQAPTVVDDAGR